MSPTSPLITYDQAPRIKSPANHEQLEALIQGTGVVPAANQIERHPLLQSNALIKYCDQKNIHITAYSVSNPLNHPG